MFRDENSRILRKARVCASSQPPEHEQSTSTKIIAQKQQKSNELPDYFNFSLETQCVFSQNSSIPPRLRSTPFEDPGIIFFFTHYVTVISSLSPGHHVLDITASPLWSHLLKSKSFFEAVSSVGLAGLGNATSNQSVMLAARHKYMAVIMHVTTALQDLNKADLGDTFKAVAMLAIFELVGSGSESSGHWGVHLDGAAALLTTIARISPSKQPGIRMQLQLCFSLFVRYFQTGKSLPPDFTETSRHCRECLVSQHLGVYPAAALVGIVNRIVELHARIKGHEISKSDLILEALLCETELKNWKRQLPVSWQFENIPASDGDVGLYDGRYHRYGDLWVARIWSHYRWIRILLHEILIAELPPLSPQSAVQRTRSLEIISRTAEEICTSAASQFSKYSVEQAMAKSVPQVTGIFLLLFPLAVAGGASGVSERLHVWVVKILDMIGYKMGVLQALTLSKLTKLRWKAAQRGKHWIVSECNGGGGGACVG